MKKFPRWILAAGLMCTAPLALACDAGHHGKHGGMGISGMDKNGDGNIDKQEFDAFHALHFQRMDANRDGKISRDEMAAAHGNKPETMKSRFESRFDETDINGDGALSNDEAEIGMPMLFSRFAEIDTDKDGKISKDEVMAGMKKMHAEHGAGMQRNP